jgi:iron complex outermembrane receptor protein
VGLDYQRTTIDQLSFYGGDGGVVDVYAPSYSGPLTYPDEPFINTYTGLKQTGIYFQDQIKWNERWVATLGGRYDMASSSLNDRSAGDTTRIKDNKFSGRAGIVYLAPGGWAPYVSYSESFTPTAAIDPISGSPFKAETGRQYETGVRYQPVGRKDSYSAAIFDLRRRNYITYDSNFVAKQTGEVAVRGLELEAQVAPVRGMNMSVAYTWTPKADVTASANASEVGKQLKAVSRNQMSLWTDYRFSNGLKLGMGVRYVGPNRGDEEAAPAKVPAYTLVDALVGYDISRWELALNLRNLTNKTYMASCDASRCWFGDQRKVTATATYRW